MPPVAIAKTFSTLARVLTPRVGEVLLAALDVPHESIQVAAVDALIARPFSAEHLEIFARFDRLPVAVHASIRGGAEALNGSFRQALLNGSPTLRKQALHVIRETRQFRQLANLLELLGRPNASDLEAVAETIRFLVNDLHDGCFAGPASGADATATDALRRQALGFLESAITRFNALAFPEEVVAAVMILGEPYHAAVKRALWHGPTECRELAARLIMENRHPGILRFIAASLSQQYPHPKVFEAIRLRTDPELIAVLLRAAERRLSTPQIQNLRQIDMLGWLQPPLELLETIPPALQPALARFVAATGLPATIKEGIHEWLLRNGTPAGRTAAEELLPMIDEVLVQEVVRESLSSENDELEAWAVSQLRSHAIPEAFQLLVERLDSQVESVRAAARNELSSFNTERVMRMAEDLAPEEARVAGTLLMKVDLDAPVKLRRQLAHPIRQKRMKTAHQVLRLGLHTHFPEAFIAMTEDLDPMVRRTGVEILRTIPTPESYRTLEGLRDDPHPRVRAEAGVALEEWEQLGSRYSPAAEK